MVINMRAPPFTRNLTARNEGPIRKHTDLALFKEKLLLVFFCADKYD